MKKEDEKHVHITVSTDVRSPIVRQCSLTIDVLPFLYNCTPVLNIVTTEVIRPAMEDANAKLIKEELKQSTFSTLEALCLSVLNSFISVTCGYICRPLLVPQEIQQDIKTKVTRFEDLSFVWHIEDNLLWVCSTREKFQSRFEELMKIVHGSKVQMEYAQVPLLTQEEEVKQTIGNVLGESVFLMTTTLFHFFDRDFTQTLICNRVTFDELITRFFKNYKATETKSNGDSVES